MSVASQVLQGGHSAAQVAAAAAAVAHYHTPTDVQGARHAAIGAALELLLCAIVEHAPMSPERTNALNSAREAKMWASAAIALEGV